MERAPLSKRPRNAPAVGSIFAEKYRVERMLGAGGMGFVFAARTVAGDEKVAIKMLLPELVGDSEMLERFLREARAARKIVSPHGIRVFDTGTLPDGAPYFVMEHLEGRDLARVLEERGRCAIPDAVDWVLQASEAIAEAHAAKTVHRDLKPSNLYLVDATDGPCIKVLDFGVSKSIASDSMSMKMTKTSAMLGTPLYMSPEQLTSARDVDERADIWSLGVILFELVSGRVPFEAPTLPELGVLVLAKPAPLLAAPGVTPELANVVATCLMRDREMRFKNLAELAEALAPFGGASARQSAARIVELLGLPAQRTSLRDSSRALAQTMPMAQSPRAQTMPMGTSPVAKTDGRDASSSRRSMMMLAAAGLFVASLGGVFATGTLRSKGSATHADTANIGAANQGGNTPVVTNPPTTTPTDSHRVDVAAGVAPSASASASNAIAPKATPPATSVNTGRPPAPTAPAVTPTRRAGE